MSTFAGEVSRQERNDVIGIAFGLLYANAVEWVAHKYILHNLGKKRNSIWSFHWANHHKAARQNEMYDVDYEQAFWKWEAGGKETVALGALLIAHAPLAVVAPWFTAALWYSGANYLYKHRRCHVDLEWGRKHMRHHYDHHMGRNQDANWCVTQPWFDWVLGTREPYAFTADERIPSWAGAGVVTTNFANDATEVAA